MKIHTLTAFTLLVFSLACQRNTSLDADWVTDQGGSLVFGKATDITTATISDFGVYSFRHGAGDWATESGSVKPDKMYNAKVVKQDALWKYESEQRWEGIAQKLSFFGYAPYGNESNKISVNSTQDDFDVPVLNFEALPALPDQIDLLVARPVLNQRPKGEPVLMSFAHALSKVSLWVYSEGSIFIDRVVISGIQYKGTVALNYPATWVLDPETTDYEINFPAPGLDLSGVTSGEPYHVSENGNHLITVPQDWAGNSTAKITFYYHTPDTENLERHYVLGERSENWSQGQAVAYLCRLTPAQLQVSEALIVPWVASSGQGGFLVNNEFRVQIAEPKIDVLKVNMVALTLGGVDCRFKVSGKKTSNVLVAELEPFYSWSSIPVPVPVPAFPKEYPIKLTKVRLSSDNGETWKDYPYEYDITRRGEPISIELAEPIE